MEPPNSGRLINWNELNGVPQGGWAVVLQAEAEATWLSRAGEEMVWGKIAAAWQYPWRND